MISGSFLQLECMSVNKESFIYSSNCQFIASSENQNANLFSQQTKNSLLLPKNNNNDNSGDNEDIIIEKSELIEDKINSTNQEPSISEMPGKGKKILFLSTNQNRIVKSFMDNGSTTSLCWLN